MKILVTGSNGLAGNGIRRASESSNDDFIFTTRADADLTDWLETWHMIGTISPTVSSTQVLE
jgi:dTDP-4-dehydrorhamnose reductase